MSKEHRATTPHAVTGERQRVVALVASLGGPMALAAVLEHLPASFPAGIVVVQHLAPGFAPTFATWLDDRTALDVLLARDGDVLRPGQVTLAPDDQHLRVHHGGRLSVERSPSRDGHRPSGDLLLESTARAYGSAAIGVVLSGLGEDGVRGLAAVRRAGGRTIAQDAESSEVYGMPRMAHEAGAAECSLSPPAIAATLRDLVDRATR